MTRNLRGSIIGSSFRINKVDGLKFISLIDETFYVDTLASVYDLCAILRSWDADTGSLNSVMELKEMSVHVRGTRIPHGVVILLSVLHDLGYPVTLLRAIEEVEARATQQGVNLSEVSPMRLDSGDD